MSSSPGAPLGPKDVRGSAVPDANGEGEAADAEAVSVRPKAFDVSRGIGRNGMIALAAAAVLVLVTFLDAFGVIHVNVFGFGSSTSQTKIAATPAPYATPAAVANAAGNDALANIVSGTPAPHGAAVATAAPTCAPGAAGCVSPTGAPATAQPTAPAAPPPAQAPVQQPLPANPFPQSPGGAVPNIDQSGPSATLPPAAAVAQSGQPAAAPGQSSQTSADAARASDITPQMAIASAIHQMQQSQGGQPAQAAPAVVAADPQQEGSLQQRSANSYDKRQPGGYIPSVRQPAVSQYEIWAGRYVRVQLDSAIIVDLPGMVRAHTVNAVKDSRTGSVVLIPPGADLIGTYNVIVGNGASRIQIAWTQIQFPDGSTFQLGGMGAADRNGWGGVSADVNDHRGRIIGSTLLTSIFAGVLAAANPASAAAGSNGSGGVQQSPGGAVAQNVLNTGNQIVGQAVALPPTLSAKEGTQLTLAVDHTIDLPPYAPLPARDQR